MLIPLPESLRHRARLSGQPVPARPAATIAVVRDGAHGLEAFLMRRQSSMAFAPGMYVFPGGGVHEADREPLHWVGPSAQDFAARFHRTPAEAHALVVAAARETFEETGVLLAGQNAETVVADASAFHDARGELETQKYSFAEFLSTHGLVLRADLLAAWSHWITPAFEPRRYDTHFFVATLPDGQRIDAVNGEADHAEWFPLREVLERIERGAAGMLPPTAVTCRELATETAATVLTAAHRRLIRPIEPRLVNVDGEFWLEVGDPDEVMEV